MIRHSIIIYWGSTNQLFAEKRKKHAKFWKWQISPPSLFGHDMPSINFYPFWSSNSMGSYIDKNQMFAKKNLLLSTRRLSLFTWRRTRRWPPYLVELLWSVLRLVCHNNLCTHIQVVKAEECLARDKSCIVKQTHMISSSRPRASFLKSASSIKHKILRCCNSMIFSAEL